jgi:polar amino acid transport system permease protein/polar amino acid transport system substrate-binding protein
LVTAVKTTVVALIALLVCSMGLAAPAGANVDQCAPPGIESASALPTNLAKAATGPGADKYTTATVEPLTAVNVNALGLSVPGTLTVGTLSDAPPSICINSAGQFTGFDNELLRAIADKLGLKVNFVGTEFSGLLAQVASRRFDVGSSSITTTDARRKTVGFTTGTTSATSLWWCLLARRSPGSTSWPKASASVSCRARCRRPTSSTRCTCSR